MCKEGLRLEDARVLIDEIVIHDIVCFSTSVHTKEVHTFWPHRSRAGADASLQQIAQQAAASQPLLLLLRAVPGQHPWSPCIVFKIHMIIICSLHCFEFFCAEPFLHAPTAAAQHA